MLAPQDLWPPPPPRDRNRWTFPAIAVAVLAVLIVAAIGISLALRNDDNKAAPAGRTATGIDTTTTTATSTPPSMPRPEAQKRLLSLLPSGYPPGTCRQGELLPGALASITCGQNTDPGGPTVTNYWLFSDQQSMLPAFTGFMDSATIEICPGRRASPGTWWHTKDPKIIVGQLACGTYKGGEQQVMWTNQQTLVLALAGGKPPGLNLDRLYKWWTSHS